MRRYARIHRLHCERHPNPGKGSHGVSILGNRRTVVRDAKDELARGTMHAMLKQLDLSIEGLVLSEVPPTCERGVRQRLVFLSMREFVYPARFTRDKETGARSS